MVRSLRELDEARRERGGKLLVFDGQPQVVMRDLIQDIGISAVYANQDYTPFS